MHKTSNQTIGSASNANLQSSLKTSKLSKILKSKGKRVINLVFLFFDKLTNRISKMLQMQSKLIYDPRERERESERDQKYRIYTEARFIHYQHQLHILSLQRSQFQL
mgnify:CR=1 FL=1